MKIAIVGTGNVGGALAEKWSDMGHEINLAVRDVENFKGKELVKRPTIQAFTVAKAVEISDVVVLSTPAASAVEVVLSLGDTSGKIIIDTMNIVKGRGPAGFSNTTDAVLAHTQTTDVVKCFNTTGANNMAHPKYGEIALDLFVAGDSLKGKQVAIQLAKDAGFAECYDVGGNEMFELMEKFAWFWINLAMFQGQGRDMGFKLLKR